jgi:hypothetical protein
MIATALFVCPIGSDAALLPRTAAITDAYHELLTANLERLSQWEPWAGEPTAVDGTRMFLEARGRA